MKKNYLKCLLVLWLSVMMLFGSSGANGSPNVNLQINLSEIFVSLDVKEASFEEFFAILKKNAGTELYISYLSEDVKNLEPISINTKKSSVEAILKSILEKSTLTYSVKGNIISIIKAPQPKTTVIKGKVMSAEKKMIAGALVLVKGTQNGAITNDNGEFEITIKQSTATLEVSYVGYVTEEIEFTGAKFLTIELEVEELKINEVIVQGYGTTTVKDATGSVSRLNAKEIGLAPMGSSVQSLLQGRAAGVNVSIQSASPTSPVNVVIRGVSTLTGNTQPLWVIDGVPDYSSNTSGDINNSLFNLNLSDVESIDILKDASATAIYGSRAANGVVIVTTKRGRNGVAPVVDISVKQGIQTINSNGTETLNASEYKRFIDNVVKNSIYTSGGINAATTGKFISEQEFKKLNTSQWDTNDLKYLPDAFGSGDNNWWDEMTQNAVSAQYDASVRGGTESSNYFGSLGYNKQKGVVKGGSSELFSGRFNFETLMGKKVKIGANLSGSLRNTNDKDAMVNSILTFRPDIPMNNEDGTINTVPADKSIENPMLTLRNRNEGHSKNLIASAFFEWKIVPFLTFKSQGTLSSNDFNTDVMSRRGSMGYDPTMNARTLSNFREDTYVIENLLTFIKEHKKHSIVAVAGHTVEKFNSNVLIGSDQNFPDDDILINVGSGTDRDGSNSYENHSAMISALARVNYKYNNRYLLTATIRADGSSKFGKERRWGYFPSGAVAWIISEEKFMKPINKYIPYLKLRGSMGISGSQNLGYYDYISQLQSSTWNGVAGIRPTTLGNEDLQWEETTALDVGLDFGLWGERIHGSVGYYSKKINNLIYRGSVPSNSSQSEINQNIGTIKNRGWEFDIKVDAIKKKDMIFTVGVNIAANDGTVDKIDGTVKELFLPYYYEYVNLVAGGKLGDWYGYKSAGRTYRTQEEIYALRTIDPKTGNVVEYNRSSDVAGNLMLMDNNGDGKITKDDRQVLGNFNPKFFGGFNLSYNWKNLYVSALFTFSYGAQRLWYNQYSHSRGETLMGNQYDNVFDSYGFNPVAGNQNPIVSFNNGLTYATDAFIYDASYIRLNAFNVSYRLPDRWFKVKFLSNIELSFSASNLFTITKYPGFDPQGNFKSENSVGTEDRVMVGQGVDMSTYPSARVYNFGLKFSLK